MNKKIPFTLFVFFSLIYFNQGISSLPSQCIYYLLRENWGLSATMIGLISCMTGLAWYIKFLWGYIADLVPKHNKQLLYANYGLIIGLYGYIIIFGLNFWTLIITGVLINICIGFNDVINDKAMVILEKKHNLKGRIQCFDEETEILTDNGWKTYKTIQKTDKVLSMNPTTQQAEYMPIAHIFKEQYQGKMYNIKTSRIDFLFSPEHRVFFKSGNKKTGLFLSAEELKKKNFKRHTSFYTTFKWKGEKQKTITFEGIKNPWVKYSRIKILSLLEKKLPYFFVYEFKYFQNLHSQTLPYKNTFGLKLHENFPKNKYNPNECVNVL